MTVLVTGATGFLGQAVVSRLLSKGVPVRAAVRSDGFDRAAEVEFVAVGDLGSTTDFSSALGGVDAIVHCAARAHVLREHAADPLTCFRAVNTAATLRLAHQAAAAGVRRLIFISSIGVNGAETFGRPFTAADPAAPHSPYALSKYEAEQGLAKIAAKTGLEVVIIRPPLIIGPDPKGNLALLKTAIDKGWPLPLGLLTRNRRDLVSLSSICSLVQICIDHPMAKDQVFLVSDGAPRSTRQIVNEISAFGRRAPRFLPVPPALLAIALNLSGRAALRSQLLGDLEIDIDHTWKTLGWSPECP